MHDQKDNHAVNDALEPINAAAPQSGVDAFVLSAKNVMRSSTKSTITRIRAPLPSKH